MSLIEIRKVHVNKSDRAMRSPMFTAIDMSVNTIAKAINEQIAMMHAITKGNLIFICVGIVCSQGMNRTYCPGLWTLLAWDSDIKLSEVIQ